MKQQHSLMALLLLFVFVTHAQVQLPRLSPAPKTVHGVQTPSFSLNGKWNFQTASIPVSPIEVPGEWIMQDFNVPEGETAIYTHNFELPADWKNMQVKIKFDGVSSYGLVKVNGQIVGEHEGGMVPFELDITNAVKSGKNALSVDVRAWTVSDRMGCISQYACHTVGGLVRKVTLFALPKTNIAGMDVFTILDNSKINAELNIRTDIAREGAGSGKIQMAYSLKNHTGNIVASTKQSVNNDGKAVAKLSVKNAHLWNSEQPYLYTLSTTLVLDGKAVQTNEQKVGLRQVEVKSNILMVNGQPIKLRGVNRHEVHPLRGRSLTPELCRKDAEIFKAGNCNYIRTSHYPPSEEFLEACDELGLFVESESALTWIQHHASPIWKKWDYQDEQYLPYMKRANIDNILAGRRHPSVIIWSIVNESRWSPLWEKVLTMVKEFDPSRPTSFHDQCWGGFNNAGSKADIANYHYPGLNGPGACDTMSRPTLFGEYAHLSCYNRTELAIDPGVRAAFGRPLVQMYDSMYNHPGCLGGALWSGIDDIFHLANGQIAGYGPWGPIDAWRREKPEYTGMKKAYTPFRVLGYNRTNNQIELTVENRYNFIDFSKINIEVGEKGKTLTPVKSNIAARSRGKIVIPVSSADKDVYLKVTDAQGFVCAEELFTAEVTETAKTKLHQLSVEDKNGMLTIKSCNNADCQTVVFNKTLGIIAQAYNSQKVLLDRGPVFCMVEMDANDGGKPNVAGETYQNNVYPGKNYSLYTIFATKFDYRKNEKGEVIVEVEASYHHGNTGKLKYVFNTDRKIVVDYEIKSVAESVKPRQYGLLFQLPKTMETLSWKRKGEFSVYPEHDIARVQGTAKLKANRLYETEVWREVPKDEWKDDANILGSVDFRSTKTQILKTSLNDNTGSGISIYGDGKQSTRSWLQDGSIQLLVANYNNVGSEPFYGSPFSTTRKTIKKGDVMKGQVSFELQ